MELRVYKGDMPALSGVAEGFTYIKRTGMYQQPGEIIVKGPLRGDAGAAHQLTPGMTIWRRGTREAYIIETVTLEPDANAPDNVMQTARGRTHAALLERRIVTGGYYQGTAADIVRQMAESILNQSGRGFPNVSLSIDRSLGDVTEYRPRPGTLLSASLEILRGSGLGLRSVFDLITGMASLEVYEGADKTSGGAKVMLDPSFDSISNARSRGTVRGSANAAYVFGDTDNQTNLPKTEVVDPASLTGYARREAAVMFRISGAGVTDAQYRSAMRAYGNIMLRTLSREISISGSVGPGGQSYKPGEDYCLGDIVLARVGGSGQFTRVRVSGLAEEYTPERSDITIILTDA